jgi:hypothetical protein
MKPSPLFAAVYACLLLSITMTAPLRAAVYNEAETRPGLAQNNTPGTAEAIAAGLFTAPEPAEVFPRTGSLSASVHGSSGYDFDESLEDLVDVDFFRFSTLGSASNLALFDIDGTVIEVDTVLALFDEAGTLIAFNDDFSFDSVENPDPGSADEYDSFIGEIELQPGNYFIAVSQYPNEPLNMECFDPLTRPDGEYGGDRCISGSAPFLEPDYTSNDPSLEGPYRLHISLRTAHTTPPAKPVFLPWLPLLLE